MKNRNFFFFFCHLTVYLILNYVGVVGMAMEEVFIQQLKLQNVSNTVLNPTSFDLLHIFQSLPKGQTRVFVRQILALWAFV